MALHDAGFNQVQVSKQLSITRCCVQNSIDKYKRQDTYDHLKRLGRSKKPGALDFRHLKRLVKDDVRLSATKVTSDLNASLPKPMITRTI